MHSVPLSCCNQNTTHWVAQRKSISHSSGGQGARGQSADRLGSWQRIWLNLACGWCLLALSSRGGKDWGAPEVSYKAVIIPEGSALVA